MRLTIARAIGLVAAAGEVSHPRPAGFLPRVDPQLMLTYVPSMHSPTPAPWEEEPDPFWGPPKGAGCPAGEAPPPELVSCTESVQRDVPPRRNGLSGLSQLGRTRLRQAGALMEEERKCCAFWTIALPGDCLRQLLQLDTWHRFQNAVRHRLVRALAREGVTPWVAGVAELHPKRSRKAGQALPHLHVLFRGRESSRRWWALSPEQTDRIVHQALGAAGVVWDGQLRGCKLEPVKFSVRRYLSKYISKPSRSGGSADIFVGDPRLCPRQWFFISRPILRLILENIKELPATFAAWLIDRRAENRQGQLYHVQRLELPSERAPSVWRVTFRSPWALFRSWEAYEMAVGYWPNFPAPA